MYSRVNAGYHTEIQILVEIAPRAINFGALFGLLGPTFQEKYKH